MSANERLKLFCKLKFMANGALLAVVQVDMVYNQHSLGGIAHCSI